MKINLSYSINVNIANLSLKEGISTLISSSQSALLITVSVWVLKETLTF